MTTARAEAGSEQVTLVGTVRAFTEAVITTERAGRVTSVPVTLGQQVSAGTVIATLENAAERAAVLQAEGSYEAALAASAQSDVSVTEAQNNLSAAEDNLKAAIASAYTTVNGTIRNTVDTFYANPDSKVPGVRIDAKGQTAFLNNERTAFQTILPEWQAGLGLMNTSNLAGEVDEAIASVNRTIALIDTFITIFNNQDDVSRYTPTELQTFSTNFTTVRGSLIGVRSSLQSGLTAVNNAKEQQTRAEISASGGTTSAADAQVKQALGALQAAQSNLSKTVLRTPIAGTINVLDIRLGDFIGAQVPAARVANNDSLEIVTYVGDKELQSLAVGNTLMLQNSIEGVITAIAPAVDPTTRKTEVRIAAESEAIKNGDTVTITTSFESVAVDAVIIPITAVKFALENGVIFLVEDAKLVERPVTIGTIRGGSVEITSGLGIDDSFVRDARGLVVGTAVEVTQ
jgi:multidrug efflux pump subunit AcrA (membrane-fusion protein)